MLDLRQKASSSKEEHIVVVVGVASDAVDARLQRIE